MDHSTDHPTSPYNYHNRVFSARQNSEGGEVDATTRFHYRQEGAIIWATYRGGEIRFGTLVGTVDPAGNLDFGYQHVNQAGQFKRGHCRSTPETLPDGRLRLYEQWQWLEDTGEGGATGESIIEEVRAEEPQPPSGPTSLPQVKQLAGHFAICRLAPDAPIPAWADGATAWTAITRTADELSIVCDDTQVPAHIDAHIEISRGWACLQLAGPLDLAATGILATLAARLAAANIPLFAVATYDTDYLLVPTDHAARALTLLNE